MKQTVKIIGGKFKGKKLYFPCMNDLRPTPNRVKETLFNWLMQDVIDAHCLDAFAGSGSLGFEAYSRGAKRVVLVESSLTIYQNLCHTASSFSSSAITIIHDQAENYLKKTAECFNIIFLDPPFAKHDIPHYMQILANAPCLGKGGLVYIESPEKISLNEVIWREIKAKQAGHVFYSLFEKC